MSENERAFDTAAIASITTGKLLVPSFSDMAEVAEHVMGHPIWTHEYASKDLSAEMTRRILDQHPNMPTDAEHVTADNYREFIAEIHAKHGKTAVIRKGGAERNAAPVETFLQAVHR